MFRGLDRPWLLRLPPLSRSPRSMGLPRPRDVEGTGRLWVSRDLDQSCPFAGGVSGGCLLLRELPVVGDSLEATNPQTSFWTLTSWRGTPSGQALLKASGLSNSWSAKTWRGLLQRGGPPLGELPPSPCGDRSLGTRGVFLLPLPPLGTASGKFPTPHLQRPRQALLSQPPPWGGTA